ncbi:hypothetical protein BDV96DRAFT_587193 [Lophiotrema nucula]|uniref:Uncharacterized protein n=1 Tax=Lophiotrema nucula TaxID=690887 RepID=A0A6A5YRG2_9PLEO|nr:hypothetical protein BDV96DRAFT_587193 [Lophiotrema nucula]
MGCGPSRPSRRHQYNGYGYGAGRPVTKVVHHNHHPYGRTSMSSARSYGYGPSPILAPRYGSGPGTRYGRGRRC